MVFSIGSHIRNLRGKESRSSFSERLEIGTTTLQRYENNERSPDIDFLIRLQRITGYSLDYLVYGKETSIPADEALIIDKFRQSDTTTKNKVLMLLLNGDSQVGTTQNFKGDVGQVVQNTNGTLTQHLKSFINKNK